MPSPSGVTGLIEIKRCQGRVLRVPIVDWTPFSLLALAAGAVAALVLLVIGALAWFLNHPVD